MPTWLGLRNTGLLSYIGGSADTTTYNFAVQVTDSIGDVATQPITLSLFALQVSDDGNPLNPGDCVSISSTPSMPPITASLISTPPLSGTVGWLLSVAYAPPSPITLPSNIPASACGLLSNPPCTFAPNSAVPFSHVWTIPFGQKIVGGSAKLTYAYGILNNQSSPFQFCIDGNPANPANPSPTTIEGQMATLEAALKPKGLLTTQAIQDLTWFWPLIANQESGFQQFCGLSSPLCSSPEPAGQPYWTQETDFGLMQTNFGAWENYATLESLFSWTTNLSNGLKILTYQGSECQTPNNPKGNGCPLQTSASLWNQSVGQYKAYIAKSKNPPPPPPDLTFGTCSFTYDTPTGVQHSFSAANWIKGYNGFDGGQFMSWNATTDQWVASDPQCYVAKVCGYTHNTNPPCLPPGYVP